jgi:hypothetical protein
MVKNSNNIFINIDYDDPATSQIKIQFVHGETKVRNCIMG